MKRHTGKSSEYVLLRIQCQEILDALQVPQTYSLDAILRWLENLRQRPLVLKELPEQIELAGACGLWLGTDDADFVFYEARTAPLHREHIILHEIGHILCDHHHAVHRGIGGFEDLLSGLQPHLIRRLMARTGYTTVEEQEAEMIASLLHSTRKTIRPRGALGRLGAFLGVSPDVRH